MDQEAGEPLDGLLESGKTFTKLLEQLTGFIGLWLVLEAAEELLVLIDSLVLARTVECFGFRFMIEWHDLQHVCINVFQAYKGVYTSSHLAAKRIVFCFLSHAKRF
jgi:hypothetical protein